MSYSIQDDDDFNESCCLNRLFCNLCCPPWPVTFIPKAIFTPPAPSYCLVADGEGRGRFIFFEKIDGCFYELWRHSLDGFFATTSHQNKIACMLFRPVPKASHTILYSHGNCSDLGTELTFCLRLGLLLDCNVFSYDYSGYGASNGKPSEKNIFADVQCAWDALRTRYGVLTERIVLFGRSLGSVPTLEVASRQQVAAVVLQSPLTSADSVVFANSKRGFCCDKFPSIDKLPEVNSPILVIHGTNDRIINVSHGISIYEKYPHRVDPLWVEGAGHHDIQFYVQYLERLRRFATVDLSSNQSRESLDQKITQLKKLNLHI